MRRIPVILHALFFLSGAAGLGLQMIWVRMFTAGLGHEVPAMLGVTAAFLGGMAVGAWALGRRINQGADAARWYGGLELVIGGWSVLSTLFIASVNQLALALTGPSPAPLQQWFVVFALPLLTLLPATAAMGATLPAMDCLLSSLRENQRCIGAVYAANTFGAVAGTLGSVFVLMPALGFRTSLLLLAAVSLLCGTTALVLRRFAGAGVKTLNVDAQRRGRSEFASVESYGESISFTRLGFTVFFTGILGIGFELAGIRVLSQVLENTVYTYAAVLSVYLLGTAAGAALYQRFGGRQALPSTLAFLLCGVSTACLLGTGLVGFSPGIYRSVRGWFGDSIHGVLLAEMFVAAMVFGPATFFMGATFSHLVQTARNSLGGVGRMAALNTLGCALAPLVIGVWLLQLLGTKWTLLVLAVGYLPFLPTLRGPKWLAAPLLITAAFAASTNLRLIDLAPGDEVVTYREGALASVAVVRTPDGHRSLRVNNRQQMGGTAAALTERRQAHIPLLLHPAPKLALFLGPGTGITLGAASAYPGLRTEGVELIPEILDLMRYFEPENEGLRTNRAIHLQASDARRFVRATTNRYDVIVADLFHPAQDGAGFLYTREHFRAIRGRLNAGGLFCQWLPLHQMDETVLRSIVRTFTETFPEARGFLLHFNVDIPALALVGTPDRMPLPADLFERRFADPLLRSHLRGVGLERPLNLFGCFAASPEALGRFAGDAPPGTDDHPVILFAAPRFTIRRDASFHALLLTFLERCRVEPGELAWLPQGSDETLAVNLADFIAARDLYLKGLVEEASRGMPAAIDLYLESARRSLHFTPAYARCVTIIQVMVSTDQEQARKLFKRLEAAQPAQPLARQMFGPLFQQPPAKE